MGILARLRSLGSRLRRDDRGVAAIEFAIVGPLLLIVMAGTADVGLAVMTRMQVNEGVSAAVNSALVSGSGLSSASADASATAIAKILQRTRGMDKANASYKITFNGGRVYNFQGGKGTPSGSTSAADECRCPTQTGGSVAWGSKINCNAPCPNKSLAGRYVSIEVTRPYTSLFPFYGFVSDGGIHVQTLALVQ